MAALLVLAAAGVIVGIVALPVNPDAGPGLRPWSGHVVLGMLALILLTCAAWVVVAARVRRADVEFAATIDADLALPALIPPRTRDQLTHMAPAEARLLPHRATLAATPRGVELWSRASTAPLVIPWSRVTRVSSVEIWDDRQYANGVQIGVLDSPLIELPLAGTGVWGRAGHAYADECAAAIRRVRDAERPTG